ncbi:MAG: hypothetical protein H7246_09315 [Phycisphaerae bacterium]|nr:hypothetical protein [Saprospiraceae bacterium]
MPKAISTVPLSAACLLALLTALPLYGQAPTKPRFEHLSTDQGLPGRYVNVITQDSKGFIWVGSSYGLSRFDGYGFKNYRYDPIDSTSISSVSSLLEDKQGGLWIGTFGDGLKYFEVEHGKFTHYRHDENKPNSLSGNAISEIYEDAQGTIWIAASGTGLNKLDRKKGQFIRYQHSPGDTTSLSDNRINVIFEDSKNNFWVGTDAGLNRFDRQKGAFSTIPINGLFGELPLSETAVNDIFEEANGNLWLGIFGQGLFLFDGQQFTRFQQDSNQPSTANSNQILKIGQDRKNGLWISTYYGGLQFFDLNSHKFSVFRHDAANPFSIAHDWPRTFLTDRENNLWIGTHRGLDRLIVPYQPFRVYVQGHVNEYGLSSDQVTAVLEDKQGMVWVGSSGAGLNRLEPNTGKVTYFKHDPKNAASLSSNTITWIHEDRKGNLWLSTSKGLNLLDRKTGRFKRYLHDPSDPASISHNIINYIHEDKNGQLWIGTGFGLDRFDPGSQQFYHYKYRPDAPQAQDEDRVYGTFVQDASGNFWIPYYQRGISRLDPQTGAFSRYRHDPGNPNTISSDYVVGVALDSKGDLLIASNAGLDQLILRPGANPPFKVNRKLVSDPVHSILTDEKGNIWLGTLQGLLKYDPSTKKTRKYDKLDGLPSNSFNIGACKSPRTGRMYFGTDNGLLVFHPDSLLDNPYIPPIAIITALYYFNTDDENGKPTEVENISYLEEVILPHYNNTLLIEFAALSYNKTSKNQYAYRFEGENDHWIQLGTDRRLRLPNLSPGTYRLHVIGSNGDGVWNEEGTRLKIVILPPWWQTWWAKTSYAIALILFILGYIRLRTRTLRKRQKELEQTVAERTVEVREKNVKLEETLDHLQTTQQQLIMQEKMASLGQMTAGIAHEIKNPLNFINNFAEGSVELADELKEEIERLQSSHDPKDQQLLLELLGDIRENAVLIHDNGQRADNIVSSMMDHANDNQGERTPTDLNALLEEYINLAYHGYQTKNTNGTIGFNKQLDASIPKLLINPQEIGRVFINLFNNAIYAVDLKAQTEKEGYHPSILVSTRQVHDQVEIRIRDNGPGIPESIRDQIFNPFFTTKPTGKGNTGLGLSISYDIVTQGHQGKLEVESVEGSFTEFVITIPASAT